MAANVKHEPTAGTREMVESMAAVGITQEQIAKVLKITKPTLNKHYKEQLETGGIKATALVAQSLYKKAMGNGLGSVTAAIFWMKANPHAKKAGWSEQNTTKLVGGSGGPDEPPIKQAVAVEIRYHRPDKPTNGG